MERARRLLLVVFLLLTAIEAQAQGFAYDYSRLYEIASPAIVTVTTDEGSASGFLASSSGLIVTNHHVVRHMRYLAVQFSDGRKVQAKVVAVNPFRDMALLKVNSSVVSNIRPLPILPVTKEETVKVGVPVVALGSPLNQKFLMTQGILSKVEDTTVLGDFLLQPGNSGGPLLNNEGEVIAINTFSEANLSGAIRIGALRDFLDSPELVRETAAVEPPPDLLRSVTTRYPVEVLNHKIEAEPFNPQTYRIRAGDFMLTVITPVFIGKFQVAQDKIRATNRHERRTKNISDPDFQGSGDTYYDWHDTTETSLDEVVTFDVRPITGLTNGSHISRIFNPLRMFGRKDGLELEFKAEFLDLRVYRDGLLIEPILPGRFLIQGVTDRKKQRFIDQAYAGSYTYVPDDFKTGSEFRIQIVDTRKPDEVHKELVFTSDSPLIQQLRSDFSHQTDKLITSAH